MTVLCLSVAGNNRSAMVEGRSHLMRGALLAVACRGMDSTRSTKLTDGGRQTAIVCSAYVSVEYYRSTILLELVDCRLGPTAYSLREYEYYRFIS
jgi:hypothetical protein